MLGRKAARIGVVIGSSLAGAYVATAATEGTGASPLPPPLELEAREARHGRHGPPPLPWPVALPAPAAVALPPDKRSPPVL